MSGRVVAEATTEEAEATAEDAATVAWDTALSMLWAALNNSRHSPQTFADDAIAKGLNQFSSITLWIR